MFFLIFLFKFCLSANELIKFSENDGLREMFLQIPFVSGTKKEVEMQLMKIMKAMPWYKHFDSDYFESLVLFNGFYERLSESFIFGLDNMQILQKILKGLKDADITSFEYSFETPHFCCSNQGDTVVVSCLCNNTIEDAFTIYLKKNEK